MPRHVRLVLATRNAHKASEIARMLAGTGVECSPLGDFPAVAEVVEDQRTIEGNAEKKAAETARACRAWALADDTGLEVDALGGAPGVRSARWAGPGRGDAGNRAKLLREMRGVPSERRGARFRTVMSLASPDGLVESVEGRLEGRIAESPRGAGGFGYDPLFELPDGRTLAQLSTDEKNALSHRGRALKAMLPRLKALGTSALAFAAALALCLPGSAFAAKTEPGQETVWDQIMADQALKGLRQGHAYLEQRQYAKALDEIRRAVAANPKDSVGYLLLGVAQYWNGLVDDSIVSYKTSLSIDPDNAEGHILLGISYAWKDDVAASEAEFRRAVELDPARADGQMNLGSILESRGDYPAALELFRKAVDIDKRNPLYRFQLGSLYRKLGRDADAVEQFKEAVRNSPDYEDAILELGCAQERLSLGPGLDDSERVRLRKEAISSLKKAVRLKPGDSVARMRLARLHLIQGDARRARGAMADAFRLTPEGDGGGLQLSIAYAGGHGRPAGPAKPEPDDRSEPDASDPLSLFERNLRRVPLGQAAVMHVSAVFLPRPKLVKAGSEEGASLKRAFAQVGAGGQESAPRSVDRDFPLAASDAAGREAQITKVMEDLRRVMAEAPPGADARLGMSLTYTRLSDVRRSDGSNPPKVSFEPRRVGNDMGLWVIGTGWIALVAEVLPEAGETPAYASDADWWTVLGLAHAAAGESQRAMEAFLNATRLDPRSTPAWLGRGVAAAMSGDEAAAVAALRQALAIEPKNKAAADGLKWLLRPAEAKEAVKR